MLLKHVLAKINGKSINTIVQKAYLMLHSYV